MPSVLLPWVERLGLRHQGCLMSAIRGCDTAPRHDPSKLAQRLLRGALLLPHGGRFANPKTYIRQEPNETDWWLTMMPFISSWDHYPHHYVWHFIHAAEIIGYCGPKKHPIYADRWNNFYFAACDRQHVMPETIDMMNERLNADAEKFNAAQGD